MSIFPVVVWVLTNIDVCEWYSRSSQPLLSAMSNAGLNFPENSGWLLSRIRESWKGRWKCGLHSLLQTPRCHTPVSRDVFGHRRTGKVCASPASLTPLPMLIELSTPQYTTCYALRRTCKNAARSCSPGVSSSHPHVSSAWIVF